MHSRRKHIRRAIACVALENGIEQESSHQINNCAVIPVRNQCQQEKKKKEHVRASNMIA